MGYQEILEMKGMGYLYPNRKGAVKEIKVKAPKPEKPINNRSEKQKDIIAELKKLYPKFLRAHPFCRIKSPDCTKIATCVNHIKGRGVDEVLDIETWEESCGPCNSYIESHDTWARANGHKANRID